MHLHRRTVLFATLILAAACGGDSGTGPKPPALPFDHPTGTPFTLPTGVTTVGALKGPDGSCDAATRVGFSAQLVEVCITLHNSTANTITTIFPPRIVLISKSGDVQNGTQVQPVSVPVPVGRDTTVVLELYCVNLSRHATAPGDEYTLGVISDNAGLQEIATILANKVIDESSVWDVQDAIWEVSDGDGLTAETRTNLQSLPNRP